MGRTKRADDRPIRSTPSKYARTSTSGSTTVNSDSLEVQDFNEPSSSQISNQTFSIDYTRLAKEILHQHILQDSTFEPTPINLV